MKSDTADSPEQLPKAIRSKDLSHMHTALAKKSGSKFLGGRWWHLIPGRKVTAPKEVIEALRRNGYVE